MGAGDVSLRREAGLSMAANVPILALEFAVVALLAGAVGAAGAGIYFLTVAVARLLHIPIASVNNAVRKRASETGAPFDEYAGLGVLALTGYICLITVVVTGSSGYVQSVTGLSPARYGSLIVLLGGIGAYGLATKLYDAAGSPGASMWTQAVREAAFVGGLVWLGSGLTASRAVLLRSAILLLLTLGIFAIVGSRPRLPSNETAVNAYRYARWVFPSRLTRTLRRRFPTILIGAFIGEAAVGVYKAAFRLAEVGSYMATPINDPLLIRTSAESSNGNTPIDLFQAAMGYTPFVAVAAVSAYVVVGESILMVLFGASFGSAWVVLVLLASSRLLYAIYSPLSSALKGTDNPSSVFYVNLAALICTLVCTPLGAWFAGSQGVAAGVLAAGVVQLAGYQYYCRHHFGRYIWSRLISRHMIAGVLTGLVVYGVVNTFHQPSTVLDTVIVAGIVVSVYPVALVGVSRTFREHVGEAFNDLSVLG